MSNLKTKPINLKLFFIGGAFIIFGFIVYGYLRATPNLQYQSENNPQIEITPKVFDFGEVEFGKIVEYAFEVKNSGDETLEIKQVSTSCGCTKAQVDKEKIAPDKRAELLVTYDSGAMGKSIIGKRVERFVYIKSNDPEKPQVEVRIWVNVK